MRIKPKYLTITEELNALDYLEKAYLFIQETESNLLAWKWVVLSLHSALYGFAICACKGTNPKNVTYKTKKGIEKLISFDDALKHCQDPKRMKMTIKSNHLVLTYKQKEAINYLKKVLRNNFEHYTPKGWSIELHGMPEIAMNVLDVIRFLVIETGNYMHLSQNQIKKIKSIVYQSKRILSNSRLYKECIIANRV